MKHVRFLFGISAFLLASCGSGPTLGGVGGDEPGATGRLSAPARDLDPAVRFAASRVEMVVESISAADGGDRRYELLTLRDEPAVVEIHSDAWPDDDRAPAPIAIEARVGRFGDADRERALVRAIARRLRDLSD